MVMSLRIFIFSTLIGLAGAARADIFDRINACQNAGGGTCIYDLLRELASTQPGGPSLNLNNGTFGSDVYRMTVTVHGMSVTLAGPPAIGEAGEYKCNGVGCSGTQYSFTINTPDQITMNYGRVWKRVP